MATKQFVHRKSWHQYIDSLYSHNLYEQNVYIASVHRIGNSAPTIFLFNTLEDSVIIEDCLAQSKQNVWEQENDKHFPNVAT